MVFRRFEPSDAMQVLRLHAEALRATDAYIEVPGYYADMEDIEGQYIATGGEFLVGESGREIVAIGGMRVHDQGIAEVRRIRVVPTMQGRGIGGDLLARLERAAAERGCMSIQLDTTVNQASAQALFASAGYREVRRGSKGGPLETIFYEKLIAKA